ncbi:MAG: DUF3127 domain-containing protein [Bacteroidales bacterium]|nr:DUF3127 domain-containing protein [Bacteroidales bacterium]MCF8402575.1 DUF3127 domain-containing protein [Bacteroidales bacterium]
MEITGKLVQVLPEEKGEGKNGPWKKQSFILETQDQFPKKVCITVWGDKVDLGSFTENELITASINIESREYNNRWYTDVKAWRIVKAQAEQPGQPPVNNIPHEITPPENIPDDPTDDLPF